MKSSLIFQVGEAIAASGVRREDLFVQTKLWRSYSGVDPKSKKPRYNTRIDLKGFSLKIP